MATERQVATTDGHRIVYDVSGTGPPLALVPGVTMDRALWHRAGYVEQLSARFTVVAMDPLGHGASDRPHDPASYRASQLVEHLLAVLDAESLDRCAIWGYSRGGLIAALTAWSVPSRVSLLVLGGTPLHFLDSSLPLPADEATADALAVGEWGPWWQVSPSLPDEVKPAIEAANDPRAISAALRGLEPVRVRPFGVPAVGYLGATDGFLAEALRAASSIGVATAVLPTGGHAETLMASDKTVSFVGPFLESTVA